jgi:hypothetical protein
MIAETVEGMSRGAASASFGAAPGTAMDMNDGMGAAEAISTTLLVVLPDWSQEREQPR